MYFYLADWLEFAIRFFGIKPDFIDLKGLEQYDIRSQSDLAHAFIAEKDRLFKDHTMTYTNSKGDKIPLTLSDIEARLYDLSFDPNHPPELRWGAPKGSAERATAPQTYTPVPGGERVPMDLSYDLEAFYRTLGQRETDASYLRGMFTTGYPIRDKFDGQLSKWFMFDEPTEPIAEWLAKKGIAPTKEAQTAPAPMPADSGKILQPVFSPR
jgi:hypothetical protein